MRVRLTGNLWEMRNAENLRLPAIGAAEFAKLPADDFCDTSADTGVDLIEYQARLTKAFDSRDLNAETDAREFAAGSRFGERLGRLSRIGANLKFHIVQSVLRPVLHSSNFDCDAKAAAGHP